MEHPGELAALGTAACWMATALAFETAGKRLGSLSVNIIRLVMAAALLSIFGLVTRGLWLPTDATPHAWGWLGVSALVGFCMGDLLLFKAFVVLGPRLSALIMSTVPVFVALLSFLVLGEVMSGQDLLAMLLVVLGIAWAIADRQPPPRDPTKAPPKPSAKGVLLALGGALGQAGGLVLSKYGMGDYDPFAATQIRVLVGIAGFAVICTATGWWPKVTAALGDKRGMAFTAIGAFFGPFVGVGLSLYAVQNAENSGVAATLMAVTPILLVPAVMLRGERVGIGGMGGPILAVLGASLFFF